MKKALINGLGILLATFSVSWAQRPANSQYTSNDTLTKSVESPVRPYKISHAEPLYMDLVRDLGARRGEREWNIGTEFSQHNGAMNWHPFIEYEFAPVNRLGLEVELPIQATVPTQDQALQVPASLQLHSVKTSIQWTFAVLKHWQTSLAVGYTNELIIRPAGHIGTLFSNEQGHPFLVAAKRWGSHWHTLLYAAWGGELLKQGPIRPSGRELNLAVHYVIPHSKAFIGIEFYQFWNGPDHEQVARPQVRIALKDNLLIGLVGSLSLNQPGSYSSFIRLIYEPRKRQH
jgi:hypothetical protein